MATRNMKDALDRYIGGREHLRVVDLYAANRRADANHQMGVQLVTWGDSSFQQYHENVLLMVSAPKAGTAYQPLDSLPFGASVMVRYADLLGALTLAHATDVHTRLPLLGTHVRFLT